MKNNRASEIVKILKSRSLKLAFAESCTGGLLADSIVSVSGASDVFLGSLVCYDTIIKRDILKVNTDIISRGVVSNECAVDMAEKLKPLFKCDIAVSTTGYAEKFSEMKDSDYAIYLALSAKDFLASKKIIPNLSRNENRAYAVDCALEMLLDYLLKL